MEILVFVGVIGLVWYVIVHGIGYVIGQGIRQGMARPPSPPAGQSFRRLFWLVAVMLVLLGWVVVEDLISQATYKRSDVGLVRMKPQYYRHGDSLPGR
jgi:hypothetical protein